jgi:galactosylceramidase
MSIFREEAVMKTLAMRKKNNGFQTTCKNCTAGFIRSYRGIMFVLVWSSALFSQTQITINGASTGRVFEGVGGVAGSERLLLDYPEPYRSDILDYLFKPNFGAGMQNIKVEIGGDVNSTCGAAASHARTRAELANPNYARGYSYWILQQAKARNPAMLLNCLEWGAPGWFTGGFSSADNADYIVKFIQGAKSAWGVDINYVGGAQNESGYDAGWIVNQLRAKLNAAGLSSVKIVAPEYDASFWGICSDFAANSALKAAIGAVGYHYVGGYNSYNRDIPTTQICKDSNVPLWSSEDWSCLGVTWDNAIKIVHLFNHMYASDRITSMLLWAFCCSSYPTVTWGTCGIMQATTPWSGHYEVPPQVWTMAHITQFAQPGWKFLDASCADQSGLSYSALKNSDNSGDYSVILATKTLAGSIAFTITGGLKLGTVHVWKSTSSATFVKQPDIVVSGSGTFSLSVEANSVYSLTTTTGQTKGVPTHAIPANAPFPIPYADNFETYPLSTLPHYTQDQSGAFEAVACTLRTGKAIVQDMVSQGITWHYHCSGEPFTIIGDPSWDSMYVQSDVFIQGTGYAAVYARLTDPGSCPAGAYGLLVYNTGNWALRKGATSITTGTIASFDPKIWHTAALQCIGNLITGFVDAAQCTQVNDATYPKGMAGFGTGWNKAQFDNLVIKKSKAQIVSAVSYTREIKQAAISSLLQKAFSNRRMVAAYGPVRCEIMGINGRRVKTFFVPNNSAGMMDFSKMNPGVYVMRVQTNKNDLVQTSMVIAR